VSDLDAALDRLREIHVRVMSLDVERASAMRDRDDALRGAKDAGASYEAIQRVTGLANATITKALRRQ
jgi:hypothetical protein